MGLRRPVKVPAYAPTIRDYLHMAARGWFVIVLATALSAGVGCLTWLTSPPIYHSSTKVLVATPGAATSFDAFYGYLTSIARATTYGRLARSTQVTARTIQQLDLAETTDELAARITVLPDTSTIFDLGVTGRDPTQIQEIAQVATGHLIGVARQIATMDGAGTELVQIDAAGPAQRVGSVWQNIVVGAALGLVISVLLVIAYALIGDRLLGRGQLGRIVAETNVGAGR
jgi:capsular polysaccharide biosynthesis protein